MSLAVRLFVIDYAFIHSSGKAPAELSASFCLLLGVAKASAGSSLKDCAAINSCPSRSVDNSVEAINNNALVYKDCVRIILLHEFCESARPSRHVCVKGFWQSFYIRR